MHITYSHTVVSYSAHMHEPLLSILRVRVTSVYYKRVLLCMTIMTTYMSQFHLTELRHYLMFLLVLFSAIHVALGSFLKKLIRCIFIWRYVLIYLFIIYVNIGVYGDCRRIWLIVSYISEK